MRESAFGVRHAFNGEMLRPGFKVAPSGRCRQIHGQARVGRPRAKDGALSAYRAPNIAALALSLSRRLASQTAYASSSFGYTGRDLVLDSNVTNPTRRMGCAALPINEAFPWNEGSRLHDPGDRDCIYGCGRPHATGVAMGIRG